MGRAALILLILIPMGDRPSHLRAQTSALIVDAGVSHTLPPGESLIDDASSYALLGTRFDVQLARTSLLFGSGYVGLTPDTDVGSWVSGTLGTAIVIPVGARVDVAATLWGNAFTVGGTFPYSGLAGRLSPELRLYLSGWTLAVRGTAGLGRTSTTFRTDLRSLTVADNLWSYGGGAEVGRLAGRAAAFLGAEAFEGSRGTYLTGYGRAVLQAGAVTTRLELGLWDTPSGFEPTGLVAVSVSVGHGLRAELSGGRSAPDPLLATQASADFGAVLSWQAIGAGSVSGDGVRLEGDEAIFSLAAPSADRVFIVGDFTLWIPVPMERGDDGVWTAELGVEPGTYEFGFLVDGEWFVPPEANGIVIDEWGQPNATLVVPQAR